MLALFPSQYASSSAASVPDPSLSGAHAPAPKGGASAQRGAAAQAQASPPAAAPAPPPPSAPPALQQQVAAHDAGALRRRLDLEDLYHLPFATSRAAWPDAALVSLIAQQAECVGDTQLAPPPPPPVAPQHTWPHAAAGGAAAPARGRGAAVAELRDAVLSALAASTAAGAPAAAAPEAAAAAAVRPAPAPLPGPRLSVGFGARGDWLDVPPALLPLWQPLQLRPAGGAKAVTWVAICPEDLREQAAAFLEVRAAAALV